jgi:hypothetical protein
VVVCDFVLLCDDYPYDDMLHYTSVYTGYGWPVLKLVTTSVGSVSGIVVRCVYQSRTALRALLYSDSEGEKNTWDEIHKLLCLLLFRVKSV